MSAADSEAAVERLATIRKDMGGDNFAAFAFVVLGMLGWQAPEVLTFLLDRAEERLTAEATS